MKPADRCRTEDIGKRRRKDYEDNELCPATGNILGAFITRASVKHKDLM